MEEFPTPTETFRFKAIELSRKLKKILQRKTFNKITTKASILTMLPKHDSPFKTKQGDLCNGHWLLKSQWISKILKKRVVTIGGLSPSETDSDSIVTSTLKFPAVYKHSIANKTSSNAYRIAIFVNSEGQQAGYKEDYIAWLQKNIYQFSLHIGDPKEPAVIMSFDQVAGYLMPAKM